MRRNAKLLKTLTALCCCGCLMTRLTVDDGSDGAGGSSAASGAAAGGNSNSAGSGVRPAAGNDAGGDSDPGEAGHGGVGSGGSSASGAAATAGDDAGGGAGSSSGGMSGGGSANGGGGSANGGGGSANGGGGSGGTAGTGSILSVKRSSGCGKTYAGASGTTVNTIATSGVKDANCSAQLANGTKVCGAWSLDRNYYVQLPTSYDPSKAYSLLLQAGGCSSNGLQVYSFDDPLKAAAIRVGLSPPPNSVGHGTNPGQGCFDEKEGNDSVDLAFYEALIERLKSQLCIDENRVFMSGSSSGSWLANEIACKYAGDASGHAIRGIVANTGGLPTEAAFVPTCSGKPMAGMWVHSLGDSTNAFAGTKTAVNRAMAVNGCSAANYDTATFDNFPIGGGNEDSVCKRIVGCPQSYPLVVCALPGTDHGNHDNIVNPGGSVFLRAFSASPLIE